MVISSVLLGILLTVTMIMIASSLGAQNSKTNRVMVGITYVLAILSGFLIGVI